MTSDHTTDATRAVLVRYERELYNARDLSLVAELLADPMTRHDAGGKVMSISNEECRARIDGFFEEFRLLEFRTVHLIVQGTLASWTYELTTTAHDGTKAVMSSIEIFEVNDGRITDVWNAEYTSGPWV